MTALRDDRATVSAVAVLAMCVATAAHEAAGHGGACLLSGGHITQLTSVFFDCSAHNGWVPAAGPLGNLVCGIVGWLLFAALPAAAARARLFALLTFAFSLYWFAGYLLYAAASNTGDYVFAWRAFFGPSQMAVRIGFGVAAVPIYLATGRFIAVQHMPLRSGWIAASVAAVLAAALYAPDRGGAITQAALEIGAASLPLLTLRTVENPAATLNRSFGWIAAACVVFVVFAATLGRGLP